MDAADLIPDAAPELIWLDGPHAPVLVVVAAVEAVEPIIETRTGSAQPVLYNGKANVKGSLVHLRGGVTLTVEDRPDAVAALMTGTDPDA